jgi:hypothetical protein
MIGSNVNDLNDHQQNLVILEADRNFQVLLRCLLTQEVFHQAQFGATTHDIYRPVPVIAADQFGSMYPRYLQPRRPDRSI